MKAVTYIEIDVPSFTSTTPETLQTFRFVMPSAYLRNDIDAIPSIDGISFTPQRISLGENLGQRASLKINFRDHRHVFATESFDSGTFFGKWRARYGNKLRGRALRLYRGTAEQTMSEMEVRYYIIDAVNGPVADGSYQIEAKDPLKYADNDRALAPAISNGYLAFSITAGDLDAQLSPVGIGDSEYAASGYLTIGGNEIIHFVRTGDVLNPITRGELGTSAQSHASLERAQTVLQYTGNSVADIAHNLLTSYAGVSLAYMDLAEWQAEVNTHMAGIFYAANLSDPVPVKTLLNELVQQAAITLYWDDRFGQIRLKVIREISTDTDVFDDNSFIEGSFQVTEQPDKRLSQVWCYYTQRNPTDTAGKEENFKNVLADVDLARETEYGGSMIRKTLGRWIQTLLAATRYTSIQLSHYRDPPRAYAFDLIAGTSVTPAGGYTVRWWGEQDTTGVAASVPVQITQVTFYSDRIHVECEEMLVSGQIVATNVVFLLPGAATFNRPATWNDADNSIHVIGGGAGGNCGTSDIHKFTGPGGGGGAYSAITNYAIGASVSCSVGVGGAGGSGVGPSFGASGGDTWLVSTGTLLAKGGVAGGTMTGGAGGAAASGVGTTKYSGGAGGSVPSSTSLGGGGGGAAGGPHGSGAAGGAGSPVGGAGGGGGGGADSGAAGGAGAVSAAGNGGNNRFGFGGGTSTSPSGQEGGGGVGGFEAANSGVGGDGEQLWTQTVAPIISAGPGGGGGGNSGGTNGGVGGEYGGGGGGAGNPTSGANGGAGGDGIIVLIWTV